MSSEMRKKLARESYDEKLDKVAALIDLIGSVPKLGKRKAARENIKNNISLD